MNTVSRLTTSAPSAIAVIEVCGPKSESWLNGHWQPVAGTKNLRIDHIRYGILKPDQPSNTTESVMEAEYGESVVVCRTAPERYEIHCHGGKEAAKKIIQSLENDGFLYRDWTESLQQSGFKTRVQQEAAIQLLMSKSIRTASILIDQLNGALERSIARLIDELPSLDAATHFRELLDQKETGLHLTHPWSVLLVGPPNAGKSSLLNAILGYKRAIVHSSAGTTRDLLTEHTSVDGWPLSITDSAGVRQATDNIESIGVNSTRDAIHHCDCLVLLMAMDQGWTSAHDEIIKHYVAPTVPTRAGTDSNEKAPKRILIVKTKFDICPRELSAGEEARYQQALMELHLYQQVRYTEISTSIYDPNSIEVLLSSLARLLVPSVPEPGSGVPFLPAHFRSLEKAWHHFHAGDMQSTHLELLSLFDQNRPIMSS